MSERKKQIWLRPDQLELNISCLLYARTKIDEGYVGSDAHKMAGRFTYRRISELLELFGHKPKAT